MTVKVSGKEWSAFYTDPDFWPKDAYHDGEFFTINGKICDERDEGINDLDKIEVTGGVAIGPDESPMSPSLEAHLRKWVKRQKIATVTVEIPKQNLEAFTAEVKKLRGVIK